MKKKFITGLLLMAVTAVGFSTLTSCKDTEEDLFNEVQQLKDGTTADIKKLTDDVLKIGAVANAAYKSSARKADSIAAILRGEIPSEADVESLAGEAIKAWATASGTNSLQASVKDIIQGMINNGQLSTGGSDTTIYVSGDTTIINHIYGDTTIINNYYTVDSCNCKFTDDQIKELVALAAQAKALIGNDLDGNGGLMNTVSGLSTKVSSLEDALYGNTTTGVKGLVSQVADLEAWFNGFVDETGAAMTPAKFQDYVQQGAWVKANKDALDNILLKKDAIGALNKAAIDALNAHYTNLAGIDDMYTKIFKGAVLPDGESAFWNYGEVMQNIINNSKAIAALQNEVDAIYSRINDLVTSLILQSAANNIYGTFNTPLGINSMILMTNFGHLATSIESFPVNNAADFGAECYTEGTIDWSSITSDIQSISKLTKETTILADTVSNGEASLGQLWFTVNPGTVNNINKAGFELVNSRDEVAKVNLIDVTKDDETLIKFGVNSNSRAAGNGNGLYNAVATVALEDLDAVKVNIEAGLVQSLKDAVNKRTAASMAHMLKEVFNQLHNVCDANALRYTYKSVSGKGGATQMNKVYSNYGLAATAFKPLSFATLQGTHIRHLPKIEPITLSKDLVNLGLKPFKIGKVTLNINLNISSIELSAVGTTIIKVKVPKKYDLDVTNNTANLPNNWENTPGMYDEITVDITKDLQSVVNSLQTSIDEWIKGTPGVEGSGLTAQINQSIQSAIDEAFNDPEKGLVPSIENQVNGMMGDIQDKLNDLVDQINNDYLGKVNRLLEKYSSIADRINKMLDDPNHYLQTVMFYRNAQGGLGFLSTSDKQPSQFKGNGEAIELYATTYNFETVAPAFKKIVGVTKVTDETGALRNDLKDAANKTMAKILDGRVNRVALDVRNAKNGVFTYEVAYQALDYTGHVSTVKCYVMVNRK